MADDQDDISQKATALSEWRIRALEKTVEALAQEMRREFVNAKEFTDLKLSLERATAEKTDRRDHFAAPIVTGLVVALVLFIAERVWPVAAAMHP